MLGNGSRARRIRRSRVSQSKEVLLLGCEGAGKTLMCHQLERYCSKQPVNPIDVTTQPTVGVELIDLTHGNFHFSVREVGGVMQPVWNRYFEGCAAVIFMSDSSSMAAMNCACVEWYNLLASSVLRDKPLLLIFNKRDDERALSEQILQLILRIPDTSSINMFGRNVAALSVSARTGEGIPALLKCVCGALTG